MISPYTELEVLTEGGSDRAKLSLHVGQDDRDGLGGVNTGENTSRDVAEDIGRETADDATDDREPTNDTGHSTEIRELAADGEAGHSGDAGNTRDVGERRSTNGVAEGESRDGAESDGGERSEGAEGEHIVRMSVGMKESVGVLWVRWERRRLELTRSRADPQEVVGLLYIQTSRSSRHREVRTRMTFRRTTGVQDQRIGIRLGRW